MKKESEAKKAAKKEASLAPQTKTQSSNSPTQPNPFLLALINSQQTKPEELPKTDFYREEMVAKTRSCEHDDAVGRQTTSEPNSQRQLASSFQQLNLKSIISSQPSPSPPAAPSGQANAAAVPI